MLSCIIKQSLYWVQPLVCQTQSKFSCVRSTGRISLFDVLYSACIDCS